MCDNNFCCFIDGIEYEPIQKPEIPTFTTTSFFFRVGVSCVDGNIVDDTHTSSDILADLVSVR